MKNCPFCGAELKDDSLFCTECGKELPKAIECPHCGAPVNEGDVFCTECGKRIDEVPQATSSEPTKPKCPHCGAYINEGDVFCMECGKKLDEPQPTEAVEVVAPKESAKETPSKIVETPQTEEKDIETPQAEEETQDFNYSYVEEEPKTWRDYKLPIFGGIFIVLFLGACWWYYRSSSKQVETETAIVDSQTAATAVSDSLSEELSPEEIVLERVKTIYDDMYKESSNGDSYWLSTELNALIKKDAEVTPDGELGCIDYDIWTQSQEEGEPKFEVKSAELQSETKAVSKIALYYPDKTSKEMTLMLVYERGNWYIDDFITSFERKESSFKEELIDCIKQTEKYFEENKSSNKGHDFGLNKAHHHHLVGTFEDSSGVYPIELDFDSSGRDVSDVVYTNVKVGSKIHLTCTYFDFWKITVSGKDGSNDFEITLECASESLFKGTAVDGNKQFVVAMEAKCSH